jgi:hypothetical protein
MELKLFCPQWGCEKMGFKDFVAKVIDAGYDGVEMGIPSDQKKAEAAVECLKKNNLEFIAQQYQTSHGDFKLYKPEYRKNLLWHAESNPVFVNSHTGKDYFSFEQNVELIDIAREISEHTGVKIIHETHRGKFSFAAHITAQYIRKIPDLRLSLDISHWHNVSESMLEDQKDAVDLALERTDHIHARVGFTQGAQIPDPRDKSWKPEVDCHLEKWDRVHKRANEAGKDSFTMTCEFGPMPYMVRMPLTGLPISDQWQINLYMKELLSDRYGK